MCCLKPFAVPIVKKALRGALFFVAILAFLCLVNFALGCELRYVLGRSSHTLLTALLATFFLILFRRDPKDLLATAVAYGLLLVPVVMLAIVAPPARILPKSFAIAVSEANCWALSVAMLTMLVTASSIFFSFAWARYLVRGFSALLWSSIVLLALFFAGYWLTHRSVLSSEILVAIWQTNPQEAMEYLSVQGDGLIVLLTGTVLGLVALSVRVVMHRQTLAAHHPRLGLALLATIAVAAFSAVKTQGNLTLGIFDGARDTVEALDGFKREVQKRQSLVAKLPAMAQKGDSGLFVVVIGESHTRDRMSAYDFKRDTTPWLRSQRENSRFAFLENAYSNYPNTVFSLSYALTSKSQYDNRKLEESPSILEILNAAGFETWWISTQVQFGAWDTPVSVIASFADEQRWLSGQIDERGHNKLLDGVLVEELAKIPVSNKKRVVFLHMTGTHTNYKHRYPSEYERWPIEDKNDRDSDRENAYDNAMYYNDRVWQSIYELLNKRSDFRALFVTSDHGEEAALGMHTPDQKLFSWSMVRIPTWVYFSESYGENHPERVEALHRNASKPWTNDMLYDALLGLTGVTGHSFYADDNDILSSKYDRPWPTLSTIHGAMPLTEDPSGLRGQN